MDIAGSRTVYSILAAYAREEPGRPWLAFEQADGKTIRWTFQEFLESVHQAARLLQSLGIGRGDVFDIHLPNHPAYAQLIVAASCLGAVAMPTNPKSTAEELSYLLEHSESKLIFTEAGALSCVKGASELPVVICRTEGADPAGSLIYEEELPKQGAEPLAAVGTAESVLQLLYTSGTTSRPKGVMLTNANIIYGAEVFRAATGLRSEDHHIIALPLFHAAAQCHAFWPSLVAGCQATILSRFSATRFFEQAGRHGATMAALFGAPIRMLLNQPERPSDRGHRLRNVTFAQSLPDHAYGEWRRRFGARLQQLWGMTETCSLPVMSPLTGERRLAAAGRPVVGYDVKIVDESGNETAAGETGEIIVRGVPGRTLMLGYLKNREATEKTLRQHKDGIWLYSGDAARRDEDGFIYFMHRGNDLIKRSGENISSVEIEGVIAAIEEVQDVCVVGLPDPVRDEAVVAVIVPKPGVRLTADVVRAHCAARLIAYKVPERVEFLESLPRTSVGKIQKNAVRDILAAKSRL